MIKIIFYGPVLEKLIVYCVIGYKIIKYQKKNKIRTFVEKRNDYLHSVIDKKIKCINVFRTLIKIVLRFD